MRLSRFVGAAALVRGLGAAALPRGAHRFDLAELTDEPLDMAPYNITNLCLDCQRPGSQKPYACDLDFDWFDLNSVRENNVSSAHCSYNLTWDGVNPAAAGGDYVTCFRDSYNYFEVKLVDFQGPDNFTLDLGHHYKDDQNFTAPWVYPTTFATPQLGLPLLKQANGSNSSSVTYYDPGPVYTNVTQVAD